MAFQTRLANCASTVATWLTVRDTVAVDTLARLATSRMSTGPLSRRMIGSRHSIRYPGVTHWEGARIGGSRGACETKRATRLALQKPTLQEGKKRNRERTNAPCNHGDSMVNVYWT